VQERGAPNGLPITHPAITGNDSPSDQSVRQANGNSRHGAWTGIDTAPPHRAEVHQTRNFFEPPDRPQGVGAVVSVTLLITSESRDCRRQLGAMAWAALEHLALAAQPEGLGWAAPVGVREVAAGLGVTKDTAARAVAALAAAGLVTQTRVDTPDGKRRSGYRLHLPEGIDAQSCPKDPDSPSPRWQADDRPSNQDRRRRPTDRDTAPADIAVPPDQKRRRTGQVPTQPKGHAVAAATHVLQPALFDLDPRVTKIVEGSP
jgi:hypothetical protein